MQVAMSGICKSFGPVRVLEGINFAATGGEIHALMGENGAGKSTLIKILSGAYSADAGSITVDGREVRIRSTRDAAMLGIATIQQELNLIPQLSVADNLFLGRELSRFGLIESREMRAAAAIWLRKIGAGHIDPALEAGSLSVGEQQLVEIARALSQDAQLLIMDEPTASLGDGEIGALFKTMRDLKARGVAILYVSHRMDEIFKICDKVSVLRDGHFIGERQVTETSFSEVVTMMVGRALQGRFPTRKVERRAVRLAVEDLADDRISGINFEVRGGEVLGVAGLMGAGRSRILRALFGMTNRISGRIKLDGEALSIANPGQAISAGFGFVTEDRKTLGLILQLSVRENATLVHLSKYSLVGIVDRQAEEAALQGLIADLHIRIADPELEVKSLSGGNQQKVVFAKWLARPPKVLLLDEPTRGVDVGGKTEIYRIINRLAEAGTAIVMVSSDISEVLAMSDRVLVMRGGRQAAILEAKRVNREDIIAAGVSGAHS